MAEVLTPKTGERPKHVKRRRPTKRFWHDARLVLFTALVTTVFTFFLNTYQFSRAKRETARVERDRLYSDCSKAYAAYRAAIIEDNQHKDELRLQNIFESFKNISVTTTNTNDTVVVNVQFPPTYGWFTARGKDEHEYEHRIKEATVLLHGCLKAATTHFSEQVNGMIAEAISIKRYPEDHVDFQSYQTRVLLCQMQPDGGKQLSDLLDEIMRASYLSLLDDPDWKLLEQILSAMKREVDESR